MASYATSFVAPNGTLLTAFDPRFYSCAGDLVIDSNQACGTSAGAVDCVGVTGGFSPNQFAEGLVGTLGGVSYAGLSVRAGAPGSGNAYWWLGTAGAAFFGVIVAGVFTSLTSPPAFAPGDFLRLEADGGNFNLLVNGVSSLLYADATYAAGQPGISSFRNDLASGMVNLRVGDLRESHGLFIPAFVGGA